MSERVRRLKVAVLKQRSSPYLRPHDLRHTCRSFLKALGVDDATIAAILRHANKSFTLRTYVHEVAGMKEAAMRKLADALFGRGDARAPT